MTVSTFERDGKTTIKGIGMMDKYVTPMELDNFVKYGPNQVLLYRHKHPSAKESNEIVGNIISVKKLDKNADGNVLLEIEAEMLDITTFQKDVIKYVKDKQDNENPIGFSPGFQSFKNTEGNKVSSRPFEWSLTHIPVCEECLATEVKSMEKTHEEIIAELQKALTEKSAKLKEFETSTAQMEDKVKTSIEAIRSQFEKAIVEKDKQLESITKQMEQTQKAPIVKEIVEREDVEFYKPYLETLKMEDLNKHLIEVRKKKAPTIVTQTLSQSAASTEEMESKDKKLMAYYERIKKESPEAYKLMMGESEAEEV